MIDIEASYVTLVHHDTSHHQLQIGADIIVDFSDDGRVLGVERVGAMVDLATLATVITHLREPQ